MIFTNLFKQSLAIYIIFFSVSIISFAQTDSTKIAETLASIDDSTITKDSINLPTKRIPFFTNFSDTQNVNDNQSFYISKKQIDFSDYRYVGNVISNIPHGIFNDFGSLGSPGEATLYNLGNGNLSIAIDNFSTNNSFFNSSNLNSIQTEDIGSIKLVPLTKGFLTSFNSNLALLLIKSQDTIKSKPISRLRYYQAPNEEGFVDAMFSAQVLPRFALAIRLSNSSIDDNYSNSEFGAWKFMAKGVYRISDSIFTKLKFNHAKLNTPLNGGIDISQFDLTSNNKINFYSNEFSTQYLVRNNATTQNILTASAFGKLLPFGYTEISAQYNYTDEKLTFKQDTVTTKYNPIYKTFAGQFYHSFSINNLTTEINSGYEILNLDSLINLPNQRIDNYYASLLVKYGFLKGTVIPSVFSKYSKYNSQSNFGFGGDINIQILKKVNFSLGYSNFEKPYSPLETSLLNIDKKQSFEIMFTSLLYKQNKVQTGISMFSINSKNTPLPLLSEGTLGQIFDYKLNENRTNLGLNLNSSVEFWNILTTTNLNFYWQSENQYEKEDNILSFKAGVYYVDTLFNNNLNLKTGLIFSFIDNPNYWVYDSQNMQSVKYFYEDNSISKFTLENVLNDKYRLDFYLAGRIQDAATFYFIYENILGNNYYVVPYYPMPDGGIRIGISWDFID